VFAISSDLLVIFARHFAHMRVSSVLDIFRSDKFIQLT